MSAPLLDGKTVAMTGAGGAFADELAGGLRDHGARLVAPDADHLLHGVVHLCTETSAMVDGPLAGLTPAEWDDRCEAVVRAAIDTCRTAHARLSGHGGAVVFVTPAVSLVGAANHAAYAAALEGVRAMAKSAARQWGPVGITVNCVAPAFALVAEGAASPIERPALDRGPVVRAEVAGVVAFLLSDAGAGVTGSTIAVDGGSVMMP
ncbi:MAG: SDR family oxidoreductase [Acidimicrobiales bacterium]